MRGTKGIIKWKMKWWELVEFIEKNGEWRERISGVYREGREELFSWVYNKWGERISRTGEWINWIGTQRQFNNPNPIYPTLDNSISDKEHIRALNY